MPTSRSNEKRQWTAAVVVTRNAPPGLGARLERIGAQADRLIVVDNATGDAEGVAELRAIEASGTAILRNGRNVGIARALNQGLQWAAAGGCAAAWLLDHDSTPDASCLQRLRTAPVARPGLRAPAIRHALDEIRCRWPQTPPGRRFRFRYAYADEMDGPEAVDHAITSGSLLDLSAYEAVGPFDEGLFIDLVDVEYCLRLRSRGLGVYAVPGARISHALGHVERRRWQSGRVVYPTHHAPERHYYMARNRVLLLRRYGARFPSWAVFELVAATKLTVKAILHERQRGRRLWMLLRGTWDGLRDRSGPMWE